VNALKTREKERYAEKREKKIKKSKFVNIKRNDCESSKTYVAQNKEVNKKS